MMREQPPIPERWAEIKYFHAHPEEHPGSGYCCDMGEESQVVLYACAIEAQRDALAAENSRLKAMVRSALNL